MVERFELEHDEDLLSIDDLKRDFEPELSTLKEWVVFPGKTDDEPVSVSENVPEPQKELTPEESEKIEIDEMEDEIKWEIFWDLLRFSRLKENECIKGWKWAENLVDEAIYDIAKLFDEDTVRVFAKEVVKGDEELEEKDKRKCIKCVEKLYTFEWKYLWKIRDMLSQWLRNNFKGVPEPTKSCFMLQQDRIKSLVENMWRWSSKYKECSNLLRVWGNNSKFDLDVLNEELDRLCENSPCEGDELWGDIRDLFLWRHKYYFELKKVTPELVSKLLESVKDGDYIAFNRLTQIDVDVARELVNHKWRVLSLNGLTQIDVDVARELAKFKWTLRLEGLTQIDVDVARELANHQWDLSLIWLRHVDVDVVKELENHSSEIRIGDWITRRSRITIDWSRLEDLDESTIMELWKDEIFRDHSSVLYYLFNSTIMGKPINDIQTFVEGRKKRKNWKEWRWNIEYNHGDRSIVSWWNKVRIYELTPENIILEWLDLPLSLEEWVWLANFKNFVKYTYPGKTVEFKKDIWNKKFMNFRETFVVENKTLIARRNLEEYCSICKSDEVMEKITEWLNY